MVTFSPSPLSSASLNQGDDVLYQGLIHLFSEAGNTDALGKRMGISVWFYMHYKSQEFLEVWDIS